MKEAHAFLEISRDFTTPAEIFRESIANSLDAYARRLWLRVTVEEVRGLETVFIDLSDDGVGMNAPPTARRIHLVKDDIDPVSRQVLGECLGRVLGVNDLLVRHRDDAHSLCLLQYRDGVCNCAGGRAAEIPCDAVARR